MSLYELISGTVIGRKHGENQDRILLRTMHRDAARPPIYLLAVADGISGCPFGGSVSRWLVTSHLEVDDIFSADHIPLVEQLHDYLQRLYRSFQREFDDIEEMLASGCTLSIAVVQGDQADCLWAGNSPIYVSHLSGGSYSTHMVSIADEIPEQNALTDSFGAHNPFHLKHRRLPMHDHSIITIATDGLTFDAVLFNEAYQRLGFGQSVVGEALEAARLYKFSDDATVVACRKTP